MNRVGTRKLVPGMVLAENVYTYDTNQLVLPKGSTLDDKSIARLAFYSILNVLVEDSVFDQAKAQVAPSDESYTARLRRSAEFKEFKHDFEDCTTGYKNLINDVVKNNAPLDTEALVSPIYSLIDKGKNPSNIFDMLHSLRSYDDATYVHSVNVALIANIIGQWMHVSDTELQILTQAGLFHDIGKLLVPGELITKPGKLTDNEYEIVKRHPQKGYEILKNLDINEHVKNAALMHHERCDGTGYPLRIKANQIDPFAKAVAIADVYDAMTSARVYRGALCPFIAISMFEEEGFMRYDADMIMTFLQNIVNTYISYQVRLSNGQEGEIIYINRDHLSKPTVKCGSEYIDLSASKNLYIQDII